MRCAKPALLTRELESWRYCKPGWRLWFRFRFGAVLVFGIEFSRLENGLVRHAGGKFLLRHKPTILAHAPNHLSAGGSLDEETPRRISLLSRLPVPNSAIPAVCRARRWKADSRATPLSFGSQRQSLGRPADWRCTPGNPLCATSHEEAGRLRRTSAGQQFVSGGIAERPKPLAQSRQLRR